jgi:nitrogen regulatory protein P-II 1
MKMVTALIQPNRLESVKKALFDAEVPKMTVTSALGCGQQKGYTETFRGVISEINLINKIRIDVAVNEDFVETTIEAIIGAARTGTIGDGKIFVSDLVECIRIRTGERGNAAVG